MPVNRDAIGKRGESIVVTLLTRPYRNGEPFFQPQFLGDKYPMIDFFVELLGVFGAPRPFFLVQARTTTRGFTTRERKLRIQVTPVQMNGLIAYPAPTYIIGIDDAAEQAYLFAAVTGGAPYLSSLPTAHPLNQATLQSLYDEVRHFWHSNPVVFRTSQFL
jgi:hypothetical protein